MNFLNSEFSENGYYSVSVTRPPEWYRPFWTQNKDGYLSCLIGPVASKNTEKKKGAGHAGDARIGAVARRQPEGQCFRPKSEDNNLSSLAYDDVSLVESVLCASVGS